AGAGATASACARALARRSFAEACLSPTSSGTWSAAPDPGIVLPAPSIPQGGGPAMACRPVRVTGYIDDRLSARAARDVERHAASCAACAAQIVFETTLRDRLRGAADLG